MNGEEKVISKQRLPNGVLVPMISVGEEEYHMAVILADRDIELSECPCDPRRRHERLGKKVAVV